MKDFDKILIANRGEIACRVIRTAKEMGYRTVAVFSEADRDALHTRLADQAVCIGPPPATQSYLDVDRILDACRKTGAGAVHPGYGFLSENTDFAGACEKEGITFIGPSAEAIRLMGSKRLSKIAMQEAGVPCIPGYEGEDQDDETLQREAERIGLPLMIKASAGGGGRGMRIVTDAGDISEQLRSARAESRNSFGSDELILERAVIRPRHVEIQVFGDHHGNVVHLGERDCSIQRRHQKVVEEAPSPAVDEALRARMGEAAVNAALACDYVGAGTVEFLLDPEGNFYFLEMNTRLQVEHPVTELITGQDLVEWQIRVARGEKLPLTQDEISLSGHAMEVRLYAESPSEGFMPQTGPVLAWHPADGPGQRVDHGLRVGYQVGSHYDPMLAKVIAAGRTREDARRRLIRAIEETTLLGVGDNRAFLAAILRDETFARGEATTAFLEESEAGTLGMEPEPVPEQAWVLAAALLAGGDSRRGRWQGWRNSGTAWQPLILECDDTRRTAWLAGDQGEVQVLLDDVTHRVALLETGADQVHAVLDDVAERFGLVREPETVWLDWHGRALVFHDQTQAPPDRADAAGTGPVRAPMDGAVMEVRCEPGQTVQKGDVLVLLEAMKIEHSLRAGIDGVVGSVQVAAGDQVKGKQVLLTVEDPQAAVQDSPAD